MTDSYWPPPRTHDFWGARGTEPVDDVEAWTRYYIFESFKVRPTRLGSIESHPDFE